MARIPHMSLRGAQSAPKQSRAARRLLRGVYPWARRRRDPRARNDAIWLALSVSLLIATAPPLRAHEGHDHGPAPAAAQPAEPPSLSGRSERLEIVARQVGDDLVVTIDRSDSNAPADAALVSVQSEGRTAMLRHCEERDEAISARERCAS